MSDIKVHLAEQETVYNIYPTKYTEWSDFYTCVPVDIKRLHKFAETDPEDVKIEREDNYGIEGKIKSSWIQIRRPRRSKMTKEQRAKNAEQLIAARAAKKNNK